jgi:hypothetical protein
MSSITGGIQFKNGVASSVASKAQRYPELLVKYKYKRLVPGLMLGYAAQRCLALMVK